MKDQKLFEVEAELIKSEGDKRIVRGYASTENLDQQGETILQNGLDFAPLMKSGFLNYDHQKSNHPELAGVSMPIIVGVPTKVERRDKGWWVEGELLKAEDTSASSLQLRMSNELWELGLALQKSGRRALAYSVEGSVLQRHGSKIVKASVKHLAITHKPVNPECTIEVLAKSFCCGNCENGGEKCTHAMEKALETSTSGPGGIQSGPHMVQNLDRNLTSVLYGQKDCDCFDKQTGKFKKGASGAMEHLTNCLGHPKETAHRFLVGLVKGSAKRPDIAALVRQSGIAG